MSEELLELFKASNLGVQENEVPENIDDNFEFDESLRNEFELDDTRIAMIGNVDSGKSTLIGILWLLSVKSSSFNELLLFI